MDGRRELVFRRWDEVMADVDNLRNGHTPLWSLESRPDPPSSGLGDPDHHPWRSGTVGGHRRCRGFPGLRCPSSSLLRPGAISRRGRDPAPVVGPARGG